MIPGEKTLFSSFFRIGVFRREVLQRLKVPDNPLRRRARGRKLFHVLDKQVAYFMDEGGKISAVLEQADHGFPVTKGDGAARPGVQGKIGIDAEVFADYIHHGISAGSSSFPLSGDASWAEIFNFCHFVVIILSSLRIFLNNEPDNIWFTGNIHLCGKYMAR
jgi:hypothetical protein